MDYDLFQEWLDNCPVEIKSYNIHGDIVVATFHVPSDYDSDAYDHGREMEDYPVDRDWETNRNPYYFSS